MREILPGDIFESFFGKVSMVLKVENALAYMSDGDVIGVTVLDTAQYEYQGNIRG
jgi:hypothetical protein